MILVRILTAVAVLVAAVVPWREAAGQGDTTRTRVVVLGVSHSAQLVAEGYQPAVLRAFVARVKPDGIAVERAPDEFARNDHYEFTYEIQHLLVPLARERGIPVHPFDWLPPVGDQLLAFGVDLQRPPVVRGPSGFGGFLSFPDSAVHRLDLLYAEAEADRAANRSWADQPAGNARMDMARRLFLYRTFMQAQRISRAAAAHRGGTLLVVVGSMHKDDLERILGGMPELTLAQPSVYGIPTAAQVREHVRPTDHFPVATFNLLGVQARTGNVDWAWVERVVASLQRAGPTPETRLLATRQEVLRGRLAPGAAAAAYAAIARDAAPGTRFTWTGVLDRSRVDSYFDPFGNLTVPRRASLERARELHREGRTAEAAAVRDQLAAELTPGQRAQLLAYWDEFVVRTP